MLKSARLQVLTISSKSTVVSSCHSLGKDLPKAFLNEGWGVKLEGVATDLGIDRGNVAFRRSKQGQRRKAAQKRFVKSNGLLKDR